MVKKISTIVVTPPNWWDIHNRIYTDVVANVRKWKKYEY